ncbi:MULTISPECIES: aspartate aminotransferase family protein [Rubrivivax]|uniref:Aspartate aminotransferase family protein n=1 Tax=Rubrivivax benzoatilyticus TaxID=316997 RepID=A0ABX0HY96_9BURK|nr:MULTISPECIES: aspartate aminotransferase family protein [Rubrivivax]MCD0423675.1 aspartate aminotransferase family protein [Rubrivivax sp. JA1024]EGJ09389.1 diaminobutyrate--2-oxoglutarate aminotransferase [Rubrivivax benzoatilyticus JA2 = ATCC BAA-35]MCC9596355.1 aspartate aminotransferase family protein [Rubrivivax sp. JA1055]MCC9647302.1 aspartate aminotransferase family protein [Rubrivivax sp. JA1029]NHK99400.1 aspartate aminotransferase family protein [Rubrivivax benzoatilyticus]
MPADTPSTAAASPFDAHESAVRSYCRSFPALFTRAKGSRLHAADGRSWIDFFAGAGTLNYGHNPEFIKRRLVEYLEADGISHALDLHTAAKAAFIETFVARVLAPRGLDYRLQFTGPTGANAVEAALKLARRVTGRSGVFAFTGAYHGLSLGALAVTANRAKRAAAGTALGDATFVPYPDGRLPAEQTLAWIERLFSDGHSGVELPAAVIVETVQAEGGIHVAPADWLAALQALCRRHGVLLIVDDIQVGCWRSGGFFSFERAGLAPDLVVLSKAIGGYGLPMSLLLIRPELDRWAPGEHTGTFRGNQLAFVAGAAALEHATDTGLEAEVRRKGERVAARLARIAALDTRLAVRGLGLVWGLDCSALGDGFAERLSARCFELGLLAETAGRRDTVLKFLPPLTTPDDELDAGFDLVARALGDLLRG